jgi:hypothetical protein
MSDESPSRRKAAAMSNQQQQFRGARMTKDFAESLAQIVADASGKHINDIDAAVDECERRVKRLADYADFINELVRQALRQQIYDSRHRSNTEQRRAAGVYGGAAKVMAAASEIVQSVASEKSLYDYFVAGATLGTLTGQQLRETAESEAAKAEGHKFNADLCSALAAIVPAEKTVKECVKESRLRTIFGGIMKRNNAA